MVFQVTWKGFEIINEKLLWPKWFLKYHEKDFESVNRKRIFMYSLDCFYMRIADTYGCMKGIDYWNANMSSFEHCPYHDILCFLKLYFIINYFAHL